MKLDQVCLLFSVGTLLIILLLLIRRESFGHCDRLEGFSNCHSKDDGKDTFKSRCAGY